MALHKDKEESVHFDKDRVVEYLIYLLSPAFFLGKSYKIVAGLVVIFFLIDTIRKKNYHLFKDPIFVVLGTWCFYLALSALWSIHSTDALTGASELFLWSLLYITVRTTLVTQKQIETFIKLQAFVVLFVFANSMMQISLGFNIFGVPPIMDRATDLVDQRWTTGHLLPVWIGLFGAILTLPVKNKKFYILIVVALIGLLLTLPLTGTRGPLIIMAIFLPLIAWMSPFRKVAFSILGGVIVVAGLFVMSSPTLQERIQTLAHPFENQKHYRIPIWLTAIEEFKDNPILGVGFHNYRYRVFEYYQDSFESYEIDPHAGKTINHTHNPWLDILSEQGLVGLTFALTLLFLIARQTYRMGGAVIIGSMGVWYTFSILNSTFVLSSDKWSFFIIVAVIFFGLIVNYMKAIQKNGSSTV